ncbi:MAG: hypothetical protein ACYTFQ_19735 [Planctomycetota bacterium]|jgi:hypothetical protein
MSDLRKKKLKRGLTPSQEYTAGKIARKAAKRANKMMAKKLEGMKQQEKTNRIKERLEVEKELGVTRGRK